MASWRRYQRDNFQQESRWMNLGSKYKNPPSGWSRQPTVPSWDKRLSTSVSKIPWEKLCERKRFECSFQNILEWNDSAVKEAAQNAKARFCAKISGLPCDTSLPDLDLYIEDVDWNAYVDPRLLSALNGERTVSEHGDDDCNHEILDSALWNQPIIPSGWGDIDDNAVMKANNTMGTGCGNYNGTADNRKGWAHSDEENKNPNVWDGGDRNWRTGKKGELHMHADITMAILQNTKATTAKRSVGRGNGKGGEGAISVHERPPLRWNSIQSCGPVYLDKFAQSSNARSWEKPVCWPI